MSQSESLASPTHIYGQHNAQAFVSPTIKSPLRIRCNLSPPSSPPTPMKMEWSPSCDTPPGTANECLSNRPTSPFQLRRTLSPSVFVDDESSPPTSACPSPVRPQRRNLLRLRNYPSTPRTLLQQDKPLCLPKHMKRLALDVQPRSAPNSALRANHNIFTPSPQKLSQRERSAAGQSHSALPCKRKNIGSSRFEEEFVVEKVIGEGEFGTVYKCRHRLDGITYAIKKSNKRIAGLADEQRLLREVYAHAVLQIQPHIVRYYSAWEEEDRMLIQNEYCDGGSLEDLMKKYRAEGRQFSEDEIRKVLKHVSRGLQCLHKQKLVHLDIKPGNIFIKTDVIVGDETPSPSSCGKTFSAVCAEEDDDDCNDVFLAEEKEARKSTVFKVGDLGHVTSLDNPEVDDGDSRYLAKEIMNENYDHLTKADIFSLGCTIVEMVTGKPLETNGPSWQDLRKGIVPPLKNYSTCLVDLLRAMLQPDPTMRPSADAILKHPFLVNSRNVPALHKSKSQLQRELVAERVRNLQLRRALEASHLPPAAASSGQQSSSFARGERNVGRFAQRSSSLSW